jgi:predicted  nucleic acid-binding Zn-ribbon protein
MNEVATIERLLAQTSDRSDRCAALIEVKTRDIALLGYSLHVDSKDVEAQLRELREERERLRDEQETLQGCVAELKRRLLLAQSESAAADAQVHINRINELLTAVQELAPKLDVCWGAIVKGSAGGFRHEVGPKVKEVQPGTADGADLFS